MASRQKPNAAGDFDGPVPPRRQQRGHRHRSRWGSEPCSVSLLQGFWTRHPAEVVRSSLAGRPSSRDGGKHSNSGLRRDRSKRPSAPKAPVVRTVRIGYRRTTSDDGGVVAVDHLRRLGGGEAHQGSEHVRVRGSPARPVVEPVELDMRNAQIGCKRRSEGGLARTCIAGDKHPRRHAHAEDGTASRRPAARRVPGHGHRQKGWFPARRLARPSGCSARARLT